MEVDLSERELIELIASMPALRRSAATLAGFVGLRKGELLGLRRCDLDLEAGELSVVQQRQLDRRGNHLVGPPKTAGQQGNPSPRTSSTAPGQGRQPRARLRLEVDRLTRTDPFVPVPSDSRMGRSEGLRRVVAYRPGTPDPIP